MSKSNKLLGVAIIVLGNILLLIGILSYNRIVLSETTIESVFAPKELTMVAYSEKEINSFDDNANDVLAGGAEKAWLPTFQQEQGVVKLSFNNRQFVAFDIIPKLSFKTYYENGQNQVKLKIYVPSSTERLGNIKIIGQATAINLNVTDSWQTLVFDAVTLIDYYYEFANSVVDNAFLIEGNSANGEIYIADFSITANEEQTDITPAADNLNIYAYCPPTDGTYYIEDELQNTGKNFKTVKNYYEYSIAGMNTLLCDYNDMYSGENWDTSITKKVMDCSYLAGIEKVIVWDNRIYELSKIQGGLIGADKRFANDSELDSYLTACVVPYINHPAFYGIELLDEPFYNYFTSIAQIFASVGRIDSNIYVRCNLHPLVNSESTASVVYPPLIGGNIYQRYEKYVEDFLLMTQSGYIMFDSYPIMANGIKPEHIRNLQIVANVCKRNNAKFYYVAQSCAFSQNGVPYLRKCNKEDMYWQLNMAMGMGAKEIAYYTYWTNRSNYANVSYYEDGASMITHSGVKTELYDTVTSLNSAIKSLSKEFNNFSYNSSTYYISKNNTYSSSHLSTAINGDFEKITGVTVNGGMAFITENKNSGTDEYMYMVINSANSVESGNSEININIKFDSMFSGAMVVYNEGESKYVEVTESGLSLTLTSGYAAYIIPKVRTEVTSGEIESFNDPISVRSIIQENFDEITWLRNYEGETGVVRLRNTAFQYHAMDIIPRQQLAAYQNQGFTKLVIKIFVPLDTPVQSVRMGSWFNEIYLYGQNATNGDIRGKWFDLECDIIEFTNLYESYANNVLDNTLFFWLPDNINAAIKYLYISDFYCR